MESGKIARFSQWKSILLICSLTFGVGTLVVQALMLSPSEVKATSSDYTLTGISTLLTNGFRPQWSADGGDWIAYDHRESDGYFDVYRIHPDGAGNECLTCNRGEIPRHNGAPNYHPSGRYLVFTAEKANHGFVPPWSTVTEPGSGVYHDVWVLDFNDGKIYQLTNVGSGLSGAPVGGSLHPRFSHNSTNTKLTWSDFESKGSAMARFGDWRIAVADFVTTPEPHLENITLYNPGARPEWFEMQDWTLDDSGVYFACAPLEGQDDYASDLCLLDLGSQQLTRLTFTSGVNGEPAEFEEHGDISPLGDAIVFMGSEPYGIDTSQNYLSWLRTDLWIINPDGSNKIRLTHFNDPGYPESDPQGERVIVSKMGWNPDGTKLVASVFYINREDAGADDEPHIKIFYFSHGNSPTATPTPAPTDTPTPVPTPGDTGFLNPSANAADSGGDGDGFEVNPGNAYADGSGYASNINGAGDRHRYYNYGVGLFTGAITGIEVRLDWWLDSAAGTSKICVELSWDGGASWSAQKCDLVETTREHTGILGGPTDGWGHAWTVDDLKDERLRVRVIANSDKSNRDFFLDWVPVKIYYSQ